ncbi:MAG: glycosyltransferase [Verrucomicrobia bacterium]|nr:glycosyltransferase [Verrucomicrobiota bacterium]
MRIAIINERWTAGATRCARDLQRGLGQRHTVQYFPEGSGPAPTVPEYFRLLAEFKPDVVHLHSFYGDLPYSFLADVAEKYPVVYTPHDPRPIGNVMLKCWNCDKFGTCFECPLVGRLKRYSLVQHQYFWERQEKRRVHNRLPADRATVVCVSDWMRERMLTTELARLPVKRIHNGIDLKVFRRDPGARASLGLPEKARVLSFIAHHSGWTVDERKGGPVLARALAEVVVPRFPDLIVLAVGGGMIPNLPQVRPIGFIKPGDIARYYSAADVFVAPSLADNLPYTVLEAMACEVPVVASRIGGIPEEIEDRVTGRLFTPGSWQELGNALVDLLENPEQTAAMGRAGRQRTEDHFEMSQFVRQYEELFASLVPAARA